MKPVKKAQKGIAKIIFSRAFVLVLLLLIQLVAFALAITYVKDYASFIYASFIILEIVSVIAIINSDSDPDFKTTWILVILVLPIFGAAFYVFVFLKENNYGDKKRNSK